MSSTDPNAPSTEEEIEAHGAASRLFSLEQDAEWLAAHGYRASLMLVIERIIKDHKLDTFGKLDAAE